MSVSEKSKCSRAFTFSTLSPKETSWPTERREASGITSETGSPLGEDGEHFAAHIARGTDDGDLVTHGSAWLVPLPTRIAPGRRLQEKHADGTRVNHALGGGGARTGPRVTQRHNLRLTLPANFSLTLTGNDRNAVTDPFPRSSTLDPSGAA
jgi:hypothetical protein